MEDKSPLLISNLAKFSTKSSDSAASANGAEAESVDTHNNESEDLESQPHQEPAKEEYTEEVDPEEKIAELQGRLSDAEDKIKELQLKYRLSLDSCEQMSKIFDKKIANANLYAITKFAKSMLDVADAFELAFKSLEGDESSVNKEFIDGIKMTEALLHKTFEKFGIERFQSLNTVFNPEIHEAMFEMPSEGPNKEKMVLQVVQNGYKIKERVLRAAKVGVSKPAKA